MGGGGGGTSVFQVVGELDLVKVSTVEPMFQDHHKNGAKVVLRGGEIGGKKFIYMEIQRVLLKKWLYKRGGWSSRVPQWQIVHDLMIISKKQILKRP